MINFKKLLSFGQYYEKQALKLFQLQDVIFPKGKFSYYDFYLEKDKLKIEVKADKFTSKTKNICIEVESNGVLSGLSLTTADFWVIYVVNKDDKYKFDEVYKIPVDILKEEVKKNTFTKQLGYKGLSKCHLIKKDKFANYLVSHPYNN